MSKESVLAEDYKILSNQLLEMNKEINILEVKVIDSYVINNFLPEFILYLGRKGTFGSLLH